MNSMDRIQITEKVRSAADKYGASNPQQLKQLTFILKKSSSRELFFGLFAFFYDSALQKNVPDRQQLAGELLIEISPDCPLQLDGCIFGSAQYWDLSVEELPWYLCKIFSKPVVISLLDELIAESDEKLSRSLKTMLFWSKGYENKDT